MGEIIFNDACLIKQLALLKKKIAMTFLCVLAISVLISQYLSEIFYNYVFFSASPSLA